jgi:putative ATP-binding cassette transporter
MTNFVTGLREAWVLAKPYFWSEEKWAARGLLAVIIALNLLNVFISVVFNYWQNSFFNAIQAYDKKTVINLLFFYQVTPGSRFPMPGFCEIAFVAIILAVYAFYLNQMLQIRWRQWSTKDFVRNWLADRAYYNISLGGVTGQAIDNPDQRISEDLRDFTTNTLALGIDFISNVVTLFSFIFVLYAVSGAITLFGVKINGYMVWVALLYSIVGTFFTQWIGRKLIPLSFNQQKVEADFRYGLIRVRENPEAIALYKGESDEILSLSERFEAVRANFWAIMRRTKALNFFTIGFSQIAGIFPIVVILPRYFAKQIGFGALTQIPNAFGQVQGAFSWFVTSYQSLVTYRATVSRLHGFTEAVSAARAASLAGPQVAQQGSALTLENLTLSLPDGRKLLNNASLTLPPGEPVVLSGPSGAGKSTLFRAIAGIWPFGTGAISRPAGSALFLPQRPYFPLGSLKRTLAYPAAETSLDDATILEALTAVGLETLSPRLHETENWNQILSGGEQQRLAIARALITKPDWLFLDEATAALDTTLATRIHNTLRQKLPGTTIIAISHHQAEIPTARHLTLTPGEVPALESQ